MSFSNLTLAVPAGMILVLAAISISLGVVLVRRRTEYRNAREAERAFRDLYETITEGVFRTTLDGRVISANPALAHLAGFDSEAEMVAEVTDIAGKWYVDPGRRAEIHRMLLGRGQIRNVLSEVYRYRTRERIWIEESVRLVRDAESGEPSYYDGTMREVTDTVRRLEMQARHEKIASIVSGCLYQCRLKPDGTSSMPYASVGLKHIFGVAPEEVVQDASPIFSVIHPDDRKALLESVQQSARTLGPWITEYRVVHKDGRIRWILGHSMPEREPDGSILWHGFLTDITERREAEARIHDLAYRDTLTGLPNRTALVEALQAGLRAPGSDSRWSALLFIDLDQFKVLNDTKGHHIGDLLLCGIAGRLREVVGPADLVARLGGDEFVIRLHAAGRTPAMAERYVAGVAERLQAAIAEPFALDGFPFQTSASIGVALFRSDEISIDELLKRADMAMYEAKTSGRGAVAFFAAEMQAVLEERLTLTTELRQALAAGKLVLHYQPQVDDAGVCIGVEALLRWEHPTRGQIPPAMFIPLAERADFGGEIDTFVLMTACRVLRRWQDNPAMRHLQMAVNIGGRQLGQRLVGRVTQALDASGAGAERLTIEITEHVMLDNVAEVDAALAALKELGVKIALDDFGTGYSSLSHLKRLPIDALKIDCSFVDDLEHDANDRVIVQTIINIARNLGVEAVAEGVENEMQALLLRRFGCHVFQGFMYGRPMPLAEIERRFADGDRGRLPVLPPSRLVV